MSPVMEQGFDFTQIAAHMVQAIPMWAILGFVVHLFLKRSEKGSEDLEQTLKLIDLKLDKMEQYFDVLEKRADAIDLAISILMRDSFSSKMIARGTGGWPKVFGTEPKKDAPPQ